MSVSIEVSESGQRTLAKVKYYMLAYVLFGQLFYQLCRQNIGFAQLTMAKDLGLTAQAFGLASGIFGFSAFLMQVPAGLLFEKFRARRWLTFNMAMWGLVVVFQSFARNSTELTILRFLLGVFEAGFLPGVYILISIWFRGKDQGVATSFVMIGLGFSAVVGGPFAGWVLGKHFFGLVGWRNLFLIEGVVTIIWSFVALRILYDDPARTSWLKPAEREFMAKYLSEYQTEKSRHGAIQTSGMWQALKDSRVIMLTVSYVFSGWTTATFLFFNPTLLKEAGKGISNQYVGFLAMGPFVVGAIVSYVWGRQSDKTERHWHCVMPLLVTTSGILLYPIAKASPMLAMLSLALVQAGNVAFFVNFWPSCNLVIGKAAMAKATAIINTGTQVGTLFAPVYFGWAIDRTGNTSLGMYTCVGVVLHQFVLMNVFFFRYKLQQKKLAATAVEVGG